MTMKTDPPSKQELKIRLRNLKRTLIKTEGAIAKLQLIEEIWALEDYLARRSYGNVVQKW